MNISEFVRLDKTNTKCFPNGLSTEEEITFIGKARTLLKSSNRITDQLGAARRSSRKLEICFTNRIFNIDTFTILGFSQSKCYYYHSISDTTQKLPDNLLKLGVDTLTDRILCIGRTNYNKNKNLIGQLGPNQQLIVPIENQLISFRNFELLCLRPSVASLKHLCRLKIRELLNHENSNIQKLKFLVEDTLLKYLKYSSELKVNQQLKMGESLISSNGKYRLSIDNQGRLFYYINEERDYLFLYDNVESLWFTDLKLLVCFKDFTNKSFLENLDSLNLLFDNAKLKLFDDGSLKIVSPHHKKSIVFQFRDDLVSYWNLKLPKFDFIYYFEDKSSLNKSDDENTSSEDTSSNSSSSSDSSDSDTSSSSSDDENSFNQLLK